MIEQRLNGELAKRGGDRHSNIEGHDIRNEKTLTDIGLSLDESSRYQKLARMPEEHFNTAVETAKSVTGQVTNAAMSGVLYRRVKCALQAG